MYISGIEPLFETYNQTKNNKKLNMFGSKLPK